MYRRLSMLNRHDRRSPAIASDGFFGIWLWLLSITAAAVAAETKPAWQQQWEQIIQGAKKEGQVTVYVHSTYAPVLTSGAFEKAFPDIKLTVVSGVENDLERRFYAPRRAGEKLAGPSLVGVVRRKE